MLRSYLIAGVCGLSAFSLAACAQAPADAPAVTGSEWSVDSAASELSYVSIKAGEIAEANTFETVTGAITAEGAATIEIEIIQSD